MIRYMLAIWSLVPVPFLNPAWTSGISQFTYYWSLVRRILGEGNGTPLQYSCLENPIDGGDWWATVHGVARSQTRLSDFTFTFHFHTLEKATATHSSVLALRIPGMGEPGGLPSMGSHRVEHDWSDLTAAAGGGFWDDLASKWNEWSCAIVWTFYGIAFLWDWNENWPFPVLWPLLSFSSLLAYWVQHFNSIIF